MQYAHLFRMQENATCAMGKCNLCRACPARLTEQRQQQQAAASSNQPTMAHIWGFQFVFVEQTKTTTGKFAQRVKWMNELVDLWNVRGKCSVTCAQSIRMINLCVLCVRFSVQRGAKKEPCYAMLLDRILRHAATLIVSVKNGRGVITFGDVATAKYRDSRRRVQKE